MRIIGWTSAGSPSPKAEGLRLPGRRGLGATEPRRAARCHEDMHAVAQSVIEFPLQDGPKIFESKSTEKSANLILDGFPREILRNKRE
jgi:hypothetical protein